MKRTPIITLLSDFGLKDPYVAEMKAVILSICRNATIVDISHEISKFDMSMGAFVLAQAAPYFPEGTIHVAVVDPGVGTKRRPIVIQAKHSFYVGPDNGVLMLSAQREGIGRVYEIANETYALRRGSETFHGRDIFCPAAAHLANGVSPSDLGPEAPDPVIPSFAKISLYKERAVGEVIYIDGFGNVVTNITPKNLEAIGIEKGNDLLVKVGRNDLTLRVCSAYGEVSKGKPLAVIGGHGFLEVSVNQGDAARMFNVKVNDKVTLEPTKRN